MTGSILLMYDFGGSNGAPGTTQETGGLGPPNIRFKTADDATIDSNNPIPIPDTGSNYSFWKHLCFKSVVAPGTQIDNFLIWTGGSGFGTGINVNIGSPDCYNTVTDVGSEYEVATGTVGTSGNAMISEHSIITAQTDLFAITSAGKWGPIAINEASNVIDASGERTDYIVLQMDVASTASAGNLDDATIWWSYDEI